MIVNHAFGFGVGTLSLEQFRAVVRDLGEAVLEGRPLGLGPRLHPAAWNAPSGDHAASTLRTWATRRAGAPEWRDEATALLRLLDNGPYLDPEEWDVVPTDEVTPPIPAGAIGEVARAALSRAWTTPPAVLISIADRGALLGDEEYRWQATRIPNARSPGEARAAVRAEVNRCLTSGADLVARLPRVAPRVQLIGTVADDLARGRIPIPPSTFLDICCALSDLADAPHLSVLLAALPHRCGRQAHDESDTVKRSPNLRRLRLSRSPDGAPLECFPHVLLGSQRMHFALHGGIVWIAYVGPHLPTKKF